MTEQFARKMEEGVKTLGLQLSEKQLEQFYDYFQFLVEKNKVMNLTAITEEDAVRHDKYEDGRKKGKVLRKCFGMQPETFEGILQDPKVPSFFKNFFKSMLFPFFDIFFTSTL